MPNVESFGRRAAVLSGPASLVELEAKEGKAYLFSDVDVLLVDVVVRALRGQATIRVEPGRHEDSVAIIGLDSHREAILHELFALENQHARGAWFHPEKASLKAGLVNFPATFTLYPRFATGLALEERARVKLADSPGAILLWAVLEPFFEQLCLPFLLRGSLSGTKSTEERTAAWVEAEAFLRAVGIDAANDLSVMRYGAGWSRMRAGEQLEAKQRFMATIQAQAGERVTILYRASRLLPLTRRYYEKAKNGRVRRAQVLTRPFERTLAGFFGGDWSRFLEYVGEGPDQDEHITFTTPAIQLGVDETAGPVAARVASLNSYWRIFDEAHGRQASTMPSLWGLVEDGRGLRSELEEPDEDPAEESVAQSPLLYRKVLPIALLNEVEDLWGTIMLPRWPERIVSEISPHALMAETFGPALRFWHGAGLTAWFVCAGYSRTDLAGLASYYHDELDELRQLGCPVDPDMFSELGEAEERLPPLEPRGVVVVIKWDEDDEEGEAEEEAASNSRWGDFENLRDIVTRYRRRWAQQYLDSFLHAKWESELREAAQRSAQAIADKAKPPTAKQFARHATKAANHWFGGNLSAVYQAIGQESPIGTWRVRLMPGDRIGFAKHVLEALGERFGGGRGQMTKYDRRQMLERLAEDSLRLVQLEEALGRQPELTEFGTPRFKRGSDVLSTDVKRAWAEYTSAVDAARRSFSTEDVNRRDE